MSARREHGPVPPLVLRLALLGALLQAAGCVSMGRVEDTWSAAQVRVYSDGGLVHERIGGANLQSRLARLPDGVKLPTILFFHGCDGLTWPGPAGFWDGLARQGYAIIAPDSFAREHRAPLCGNSIQYSVRDPEVEHALAQVRTLRWVDPANIFLVGHSEGAGAVARYRGDQVRGIVILGVDCRHGLHFRGPSLAIYSRRDRWIKADAPCHGASERLVIESNAHDALRFRESQQRVRRFLQRHTLR